MLSRIASPSENKPRADNDKSAFILGRSTVGGHSITAKPVTLNLSEFLTRGGKLVLTHVQMYVRQQKCGVLTTIRSTPSDVEARKLRLEIHLPSFTGGRRAGKVYGVLVTVLSRNLRHWAGCFRLGNNGSIGFNSILWRQLHCYACRWLKGEKRR
jgi:hypothetical protein